MRNLKCTTQHLDGCPHTQHLDAPPLSSLVRTAAFCDAASMGFWQVDQAFECVCEEYFGPREPRAWTENALAKLLDVYDI